MRTQFIQTENLSDAENDAHWAAEIVEVEGGFMVFESVDDFNTWNNQQ
jgi:hypothetical protein